MEQWKDEVKKKTVKGLLKVTTHHGPSRLEGAQCRSTALLRDILTFLPQMLEPSRSLTLSSVSSHHPSCSLPASPHPLFCFSQITTYQVVASEHATYLASKAKEVDSGDSDSEENSFGSSLGKPNKKGTKKPAPTKKKAAGKSFCALFGVKWHRIVLGAPVSVLDSRCTKLISSDHP